MFPRNTGGGAPTGPAGGILTGTYPNPTGLANGAIATTQAPGDATTKVATDAFVAAALGGTAPFPMMEPPVGGFVILPYSFTSTTATPVAGTDGLVTYYPLYVAGTRTIVGISQRCNVAGSAGATVRMGIFADAGGAPGAVIADGGAAPNVTSSTITTITFSQAVSGIVWIAHVLQGEPVTQATVEANAAASILPTLTANGTGDTGTDIRYAYYTQTGVTGPFAAASGLTKQAAVSVQPPILVVSF